MCSSFAKKKGAPFPRPAHRRQAFPWRLARTGNRREGILRSTRPAARLTGEWKTKKNATGRPSTSFRWGRVSGSPCSANGTRAGRPRGRLRGCPDQNARRPCRGTRLRGVTAATCQAASAETSLKKGSGRICVSPSFHFQRTICLPSMTHNPPVGRKKRPFCPPKATGTKRPLHRITCCPNLRIGTGTSAQGH